jgi:hypothetical protein
MELSLEWSEKKSPPASRKGDKQLKTNDVMAVSPVFYHPKNY